MDYLHILQNVAVSSGTGDQEYVKLKEIMKAIPEISYLCLDVANGYSEHFVSFLRQVRKDFPTKTIIVSHVHNNELLVCMQ